MNTSAISALAGTAHLASGAAALARPGAAGFNATALRQAPPAEQRAAVAAQFEAILVRQLLGKTMNSMLGGAESGVAGTVYGDMLANNLAQQLSAGPGLGLGRFLAQQLAPSAPAPADAPTTETKPTP